MLTCFLEICTLLCQGKGLCTAVKFLWWIKRMHGTLRSSQGWVGFFTDCFNILRLTFLTRKSAWAKRWLHLVRSKKYARLNTYPSLQSLCPTFLRKVAILLYQPIFDTGVDSKEPIRALESEFLLIAMTFWTFSGYRTTIADEECSCSCFLKKISPDASIW